MANFNTGSVNAGPFTRQGQGMNINAASGAIGGIFQMALQQQMASRARNEQRLYQGELIADQRAYQEENEQRRFDRGVADEERRNAREFNESLAFNEIASDQRKRASMEMAALQNEFDRANEIDKAQLEAKVAGMEVDFRQEIFLSRDAINPEVKMNLADANPATRDLTDEQLLTNMIAGRPHFQDRSPDGTIKPNATAKNRLKQMRGQTGIRVLDEDALFSVIENIQGQIQAEEDPRVQAALMEKLPEIWDEVGSSHKTAFDVQQDFVKGGMDLLDQEFGRVSTPSVQGSREDVMQFVGPGDSAKGTKTALNANQGKQFASLNMEALDQEFSLPLSELQGYDSLAPVVEQLGPLAADAITDGITGNFVRGDDGAVTGVNFDGPWGEMLGEAFDVNRGALNQLVGKFTQGTAFGKADEEVAGMLVGTRQPKVNARNAPAVARPAASPPADTKSQLDMLRELLDQ